MVVRAAAGEAGVAGDLGREVLALPGEEERDAAWPPATVWGASVSGRVPMLAFTLDTNCLIAVEEQRPSAVDVQALVARHRAGEVVVRLVATTAAENQRNGKMLSNFQLFQQRLRGVGWGDLDILRPVCVFDLTYWDWCVFGSDTVSDELQRIHTVLFPTAPFEFGQAVPDGLDTTARALAERKWRNRQLDALVLHTHIQAGADVFVTSDANFMKMGKAAKLAALGASTVLTPSDAARYRLPPSAVTAD